MNLHPVIRLACFLLLVAGLAISKTILVFALFPLCLLLFRIYCSFSAVFFLLKRLRWLFLSILILNLWLNSPSFFGLPNLADFLLALGRVIVLIIIVLVAHLLITKTLIQEIIAALQWWFTPLHKIGFSTTRLAVRLALVLDTVQAVQNLYMDTPIGQTRRFAPTSQSPIKRISHKVAELFTQVVIYAETTPLRTLEIPKLQSPPQWQWLYPLFMLVFFWVAYWVIP